MPIKLEPLVVFKGYRPPREDAPGLTPRQRNERRESVRRASRLIYDSNMTAERAEVVLALTPAELMDRLDLDAEQVEDLQDIARAHLRRLRPEEATA